MSTTQNDRLKTLHADADRILETAKREHRDLTTDETIRFDRIMDQITPITETMKRGKALATAVFAASKGLGFADGFGVRSEAQVQADRFEGGGGDYELFNRQLNEGGNGTKEIQIPKGLQLVRGMGWKNNFVITSGVDSGNLVPKQVTIPTIVRRWYNSFVRAMTLTGYTPLMTATGENLTIPIVDDTSVTGNSPSEDASGDTEADPPISDVTLGNTLFGSKSIWVSNTMINTIGYDIAGYIMPILDKRVELAQDANFITALLSAQSGVESEDYSVTGNTVFLDSAAITYANLLKLYHALPVPYRQDGVFIFADTLIQAIESLVDSNGRPLVNLIDPLLDGVLTKSIWGCPVVPSLNMPSFANGNVCGAFVSGECLKARFVTNRRVARYTNIPTYPDQVGFQLFENAAAGVVAAGCVFLKAGAS